MYPLPPSRALNMVKLTFCFIITLLLFAVPPRPLFAQEGVPEESQTVTDTECSGTYLPPTMTLNDDGAEPERLIAPPLPEHPTQLDCGAFQFAQYCMACHGDRGQGLTEEWRQAWGDDEKNCWQSKCHASNHPPEGFELPRYAPQIMGDAALGRFTTVEDLYDFISVKMPWHAPGVLEDKTYWQLTAFLAQSNGATWDGYLSHDNAPQVRLRLLPQVQPLPRKDAPPEVHIVPPWVFGAWLGAMVVLGVGGGIWAMRQSGK